MTREEYLQVIGKCKINNSKVNEIENIYGKEIPDIIQRMISYSDDSIFFDDDWRTLSFSEIAEADSDLHTAFIEKGFIPIVDCGENDFIIYHFADGIWSKYNIIEECIFKKKHLLEELL